MKLYFAPNSRAVRVAWLLEELELPYQVQKFTLGAREMREAPYLACLLYTSPSPRDATLSRMPSSA